MTSQSTPIEPGHTFSKTSHISFDYYSQQKSPATYGYQYYLSLPPSYESSLNQRYPLILFLHGSGESQHSDNNDSYASLRHGIPKIILCYDKLKSGVAPPRVDIPTAERFRRKGKVDPGDMSGDPVDEEVCKLVAETFITVTPSLNLKNGYGWNVPVLSALLDEITSAYRIDVDQIHLTGFSMGGFGTWALGIHSPRRFATLMPICGGGDAVLVKDTAQIPQWVYHGDKDDIVPCSKSVEMVNALKKAGADDIKFTRYPDMKHDSWTAAYGNAEAYRWMLSHKRKATGDEVVVPEENKVDVTRVAVDSRS